MRSLLALAALVAAADCAAAGPILDRLRARRGCQPCQQGPAVAFRPAPAAAYPGPAVTCAGGVCYPAAAVPAVPANPCPGGFCPVPVRR